MADWGEILGILLAALIVLIPITGFTLRFAIRPISEAIASIRSAQAGGGEVAQLRGEVEALQGQMNQMETVLNRLAEAQEFQAQLLKPREGP